MGSVHPPVDNAHWGVYTPEWGPNWAAKLSADGLINGRKMAPQCFNNCPEVTPNTAPPNLHYLLAHSELTKNMCHGDVTMLPGGESPLGGVRPPAGSPHCGVYTPRWGIPIGDCTLPSGALGSVLPPAGSPHCWVYPPQWGVLNWACSLKVCKTTTPPNSPTKPGTVRGKTECNNMESGWGDMRHTCGSSCSFTHFVPEGVHP